MKQSKLLIAAITVLLISTAAAQSKDFIIQNNQGENILVANGTTDNVQTPNGNLTLGDNSNISNFFDQDQCGPDEAIKTVLPNGSYVCNSISTTTSAENLSETLNAGNSAGDNNINLSGNNLTEINTLNANGSELRIGGNVTVGDGSSIAEVNRLTDLPVQPTVDSFEDGDLDEYQGNLSNFSVQSNTVLEGSRTLEIETGETTITSAEGDGLDSYIQRGSTFEFLIDNSATCSTTNPGAKGGVMFGLEQTEPENPSGYSVGIECFQSGKFPFIKRFGSSPTVLDSPSSVLGDGPLRFFVSWSEEGNISVDIYNSGSPVESLSAQDTTYTGSGVGFRRTDTRSDSLFIDGVKIVEGDGIEVDSDLQLADSSISNLSSLGGGGDRVDVTDEIDLNNNNISNFFDQNKCGPNQAIKTVYPNGSYACNQLSTTTQAENLSETLSAGNNAGENNLNLSGNNITNVDTVKGSSPVSFADNVNLTQNNITDVGNIEFKDAGGNILNVDQLSLSEGSSDFRLRVGGEKFLDEDFEDGKLAPFENSTSNDVNWTITSDTPYGDHAAEAGDPDNNEDSQIETDVSEAERLVFRYKFTTEGGTYASDTADVTVGGETKYLDPTGSEWSVRSFDISSGSNTLKFEVDGGCDSIVSPIGGCSAEVNSTLRVDDVRVFNTTENAVTVYGSQSLNTGDLNQVNRINFVEGIDVGQGSNATSPGSTSVGRDSKAYSNAVAIGPDSTASGGDSVAIGPDSTASGGDSVAIGPNSTASGGDSVAIGPDSTASGGDSVAIGPNSTASGGDSVAIGPFANAPNPQEATFGALDTDLFGFSNRLDVNVTGNLTVHQRAAFGDNSVNGLSSGDINASDIYYDRTVAKSPVVQCSQGSDWCSVSVPENQSSFFVKKGEEFDKDRPRSTAEEVVESDVETIERFEELRKENQRQEERIEELNSTVQSLKSVLCKDNPEAEVCQ